MLNWVSDNNILWPKNTDNVVTAYVTYQCDFWDFKSVIKYLSSALYKAE